MANNTQTTKINIKKLSILRELLPYFWISDWHIRLRILGSFLLTLIMIAFNVSVPLFLKNIINILSTKTDQSTYILPFVLLGYGAVWILSRMASELREMVLFRAMERSINSMSLALFEHLHALSMSFHLDRKTGSITNAIERIQKAFPDIIWSLIVMVPTVIEIIVAMGILWYLYGLQYGVILLVVLIASFLFSGICLRLIAPMQKRHNENNAKSSAFVTDSLLNFETVKYFGNNRFEVERCRTILQDRENSTTRLYTYRGIVGLGQNAILGVGLVLVTWKSGYAVFAGTMKVGDFVVINSYLLQFVSPVQYFSYFIRQITKGLADMENAINLLRTKPEILDVPDAAPLVIDGKATVTFDHVSFGYSSRGLILKDVSFTVPAGKSVAIVGTSGAGKSTISRLLFRFYDVTSGKIFINGQDIRLVAQESLRKNIGIVPQDTMLFNNTLFYNVAYARPDASREEVERAIQLARLDGFVSRLPLGYDTIVGERGLKLSGGEKQRVAIARVILKQPKIYVFDEATSALDTVTERQIQRNLEEVSAGSTTFIIAHRLSTITNVDEIIVLDQGRIVQRGTHAALLLEEDGIYAKLWKKQSMCPE